ncbi:hypothetical protein F5Y09DRAFT_126674 [Xylaria sp. FL1042]|nr:hypothetical protein F5Y09DRAFT_126674 [Xylaria sp. FL1042]
MTNLGPLTTTYTAINSRSCRSIHLATDSEGFWLERGDVSEGCLPPDFTPLDGYYYSPGICQPGYTYACITSNGLQLGTTAATCCPSGFSCRRTRSYNDNAACESTLGSDSSYIGDVIAYPDGDLSVIGTTSTLIRAGEIVYAEGIPVRRAASDPQWNIASTNSGSTETQTGTLPTSIRSTTKSSGSTLSTKSTSTLGVLESSTSFSSRASEESTATSAVQTGLSTGAKAAIGVGATFGLFLFLAAIAAIYYIVKNKGRASAHPQDSQEATSTTEEKSSRHVPRYELEGQMGPQEMNADREPVELTSHWEPVEMS